MATVRRLIKTYPVLTYFVLAFAISWGGVLLAIGGPARLSATAEEVRRLRMSVWTAYVAGPMMASLFLTVVIAGRSGLHELLSRSLRWRVGARWYAVALLTVPVLTSIVFFALALLSPVFLPIIVTSDNKASLLLLAILGAIGGAFAEELGWTGFAIPRLMPRHGILRTGLTVGTVWGAWHLLANVWWSGSNSGGLSLAVFLPAYFLIGVAQLTAFRILMVWVYDRTESVLAVTLMHASLIVSTVALVPPTTGVDFLIWFGVFTALLWIIVAGATRAGSFAAASSG